MFPKPLDSTRRLAKSGWFWLAMAVGGWLRVAGLFRQVLIDDEAHAFRWALQLDFSEALVRIPFTANSPPINALLRGLIDLGLQPTELTLRVPIMLSGLALLIFVPLWVARHAGTRIGVTIAWVLAISPPLVFHSRFMRPYMPYALLVTLALAAFYAWWYEGSRRAGYLYAIAAVAAIYVHVLATPMVILPWLFVALELWRRRADDRPRRWADIARTLLALGALLALYVGPAWPHLWKLAASRREQSTLELLDLWQTTMVLGGTRWPWLMVAVLFLTLFGAWRLLRERRQFAIYLGVLAAGHILAVPLLSPTFITNPLIFARYLLPALVPTLVFLAAGLVGTGSRPVLISRALPTIVIFLLFVSGPLTDPRIYRYSLGLRAGILNVVEEPIAHLRPPVGYDSLAAGPPGKIVEYPARIGRRFVRTLGDYQAVHGRQVVVSPGERRLTDPRYALATILPPEPEVLLQSGAAYLIVHRDWEAELGPRLGYTWPTSDARLKKARKEQERLKRATRRFCRRLALEWGEPDTRNSILWIWNLERVRARQGDVSRSESALPEPPAGA